jgi:hypothetical protein
MTSNDDWRVHVTIHGHGGFARSLTERLDAADLEHDLENAFHDKVIVSIDGPALFAYTGTREQAESVAELVRKVAADHDPEIALARWHPTAEEWEDADTPLPQTDADRLAEHAELVERERAEAAAQGYPDYEVRISCSSRSEAAELADRLAGAGLRSVHRHKYLLLGATDEDSANALADQVRGLAPSGAVVTIEATGAAVEEAVGPSPFAIFGGLGG